MFENSFSKTPEFSLGVGVSNPEETVPKEIAEIISEYTYDGYTYMHTEQPENMKMLEKYLQTKFIHIDAAYRRTDYQPFLNATKGDTLTIDRISSWSLNVIVPNAMYDGVKSIMFILENANVNGLDVTHISFYKNEEEIILSPCILHVINVVGDLVYVEYINQKN